jgi:hypothetical protein
VTWHGRQENFLGSLNNMAERKPGKELKTTWFEKRNGVPPIPNLVNRGRPLSKIMPNDAEIIQLSLKLAIPDIEEKGRLIIDNWDPHMKCFAVRDITEEEYAKIDEALRQIVIDMGYDPKIDHERSAIHRLRTEVYDM